jgi:hypothetical protein
MTALAPELGDVDSAFSEALAADSGAAVDHGPPVSAPPKKSDNPDAPHGYAEDGVTALAPYGHKADGRPRIKPGGPGRARAAGDDRARVAPMRPASSQAGPGPGAGSSSTDGPDFTEQLADLGTTVWLAGSMLRGGRLIIVPVPDVRPYAAVFKQQLPGLVGAWNVAARQSPAVRGYVERVSGEGAWSWKVGVAVTMVGLAAACAEMAKAPPAVKAAAAAVNDAELERFMTAQIAELGLEAAGPVTDGPAGQDQAAAA